MTERDYNKISNEVYNIDKLKVRKDNIEKGDKILEDKYKVLSLEDNQNNGMQVVVVAPINSVGEVDIRKIVIIV